MSWPAILTPAEKLFVIRMAEGEDAEYAPDPRLDGFPAAALVMCNVSSLAWGVYHMFFYWSHVESDLLLISSEETYPIAWFWVNLFNPERGWMALGYLFDFILYLAVFGLEVIGMLMVHLAGRTALVVYWIPKSFWIIFTMLWLPPLFFFLQLALPKDYGSAKGFGYDLDAPGFENAMTVFKADLFVWGQALGIHLFFARRYLMFAKTQLFTKDIKAKCKKRKNELFKPHKYQVRCLQQAIDIEAMNLSEEDRLKQWQRMNNFSGRQQKEELRKIQMQATSTTVNAGPPGTPTLQPSTTKLEWSTTRKTPSNFSKRSKPAFSVLHDVGAVDENSPKPNSSKSGGVTTPKNTTKPFSRLLMVTATPTGGGVTKPYASSTTTTSTTKPKFKPPPGSNPAFSMLHDLNLPKKKLNLLSEARDFADENDDLPF